MQHIVCFDRFRSRVPTFTLIAGMLLFRVCSWDHGLGRWVYGNQTLPLQLGHFSWPSYITRGLPPPANHPLNGGFHFPTPLSKKYKLKIFAEPDVRLPRLPGGPARGRALPRRTPLDSPRGRVLPHRRLILLLVVRGRAAGAAPAQVPGAGERGRGGAPGVGALAPVHPAAKGGRLRRRGHRGGQVSLK